MENWGQKREPIMSRQSHNSDHKRDIPRSTALRSAKRERRSTLLSAIDDAKSKWHHSLSTTFLEKPSSVQKLTAKDTSDDFGTEAWLGWMAFLGALLGFAAARLNLLLGLCPHPFALFFS